MLDMGLQRGVCVFFVVFCPISTQVLAILNQFQFENSHGELQPAVLAVFNGHDHDVG